MIVLESRAQLLFEMRRGFIELMWLLPTSSMGSVIEVGPRDGNIACSKFKNKDFIVTSLFEPNRAPTNLLAVDVMAFYRRSRTMITENTPSVDV